MSTTRFANERFNVKYELCISTLNRISQNFPANVFHVDDRIYSGGSLAKAYNIIIQSSLKPFPHAMQENNRPPIQFNNHIHPLGHEYLSCVMVSWSTVKTSPCTNLHMTGRN